jgi:hypothetical protein
MTITWKNVDWKHLALGALFAGVGAVLSFLTNENWSQMLGPSGGLIVAGALQIINEIYTNSTSTSKTGA